MRQKDRSTNSFRRLLNEISMLMATLRGHARHADAADRDPRRRSRPCGAAGDRRHGHGSDGVIETLLSVLAIDMRVRRRRFDGMLEVVPGARIGHIGLYRDPEDANLVAVEYHKMPHDMHERDAIVLDPMLATGNSAVAAVDRLRRPPKSIPPLSACSPRPRASPTSAPATPTCRSTLRAIDRQLDDHGYILPGLGDAGDRAVRHQ